MYNVLHLQQLTNFYGYLENIVLEYNMKFLVKTALVPRKYYDYISFSR